MYELPETGFLRLAQIIGDREANPPIPAVVPVGKSTWWAGVKTGRYPQPVRTLSARVTCWRVEDIRRLLAGEMNFPREDASIARRESPALIKGRRKFWSDVATGKRPHPRKKSTPQIGSSNTRE